MFGSDQKENAIMSTIDKKDKFLAGLMKSPAADTVGNQQQLREEAYRAIHNLQFPTLKDERWKYTRVAGILKKDFEHKPGTAPASIEEYQIKGYEADCLVFVNGAYSVELSETEKSSGVQVLTLAQAKVEHYDVIDKWMGSVADHKGNIFTAMNTAFHKSGVMVYAPKGSKVNRPVHIIDITTGEGVTHAPRNLFVAEDDAQIRVTHSFYGGAGENFINGVSEIYLGKHANVEYQLIQENGGESNHIQSTDVYQSTGSVFTSGAFTTGGKLIRNEINVSVNGEHCETRLNGAFLTGDRQHVDNHTVIDHIKPACNSHENYKGIMAGKSTGVFNGKVFVRKDAQQINAFQSNQNILLDDSAVINSKPELEIYADDVKCSHGSTTGQLDEEALFYLRARGLTKADAINILVNAFTAETLEYVSNDALADYISNLVERRSEELNNNDSENK